MISKERIFEIAQDNGLVHSSNAHRIADKIYAALKDEHPATEDSGTQDLLRDAIAEIERLKKITTEEPLAVLADRLGFWKVEYMEFGQGDYRVTMITRIGNEVFNFNGKTYQEAESRAREYLNTLPDREDKK